MVRYEELLAAHAVPRWKGFYIEYARLKELLRSMARDSEGLPNRVDEFMRQLDFEISRAATCYNNELNDIKRSLETIRSNWKFLSPTTFRSIYVACKQLVRNLTDVLIFMELNAEAVRRLLMKADDMAAGKDFDHRKMLKDRLRPDNLTSAFGELRIHHGTKDIITELRKRLDTLRYMESVWIDRGIISADFSRIVHARRDTETMVADLYLVARQTAVSTKWYYKLLNEAEIDYESQPVGQATRAGLFLNNFNTFLYMANYYLVIPTAAEYAQAVGLPRNISGLLLAMTPFSSLFASVGYSIWSNHNFTAPLVFCTAVLIFGNLLYGLALDYKAPWMLFVGRLLVGIGGNRAVNRRYISDFVPMSNRTLQSAIFVTVGSLGMSLGPGMQPLVNQLPNVQLPYTGWTFNNLTAPPLIMVAVWAFFALATVMFFDEPTRKYASRRADLLEPLLQDPDLSDHQQSLAAYEMNSFMRSQAETNYICHANGRGMAADRRGRSARASFMDTTGAYVCLVIYFCLKFVQEAFQTAAPLVTAEKFMWSDSRVGVLLAAIGLIVLPSNILIGWMGNAVPDRWGQLVALAFLIVGTGLTLENVTPYIRELSVSRYVAGAFVLFIAAQALESINMSLLSKLMPKALSKGLWNSGFLSTEFGTLGRVMGAALITLAGMVVANGDSIQNAIDYTSLIMVGATICVCLWFWTSLVPLTERCLNTTSDDADTIADIVPIDSLETLHPALRPLCISTVASGLHSISPVQPLKQLTSKMASIIESRFHSRKFNSRPPASGLAHHQEDQDSDSPDDPWSGLGGDEPLPSTPFPFRSEEISSRLQRHARTLKPYSPEDIRLTVSPK